MYTDIHGLFQRAARADELDAGAVAWIDVETEYEFDRHYKLFAWLGNVKNGVAMLAGIKPLSSNRGWPADFGRNPNNDNDDEWLGDHSFSWLLDDEILNTEPPSFMSTGVISVEEFREWDGESEPDFYHTKIDGPRVKVRSAAEIDLPDTTHVRISFLTSGRNEFAYFIDEVRRLKTLHGQVRFVFGFDS